MLKVGISRKGRKCKFYGCKHILSIYNHDAYCNVHGKMVTNKESAVIIKSIRI